jgi:hypothetical protein
MSGKALAVSVSGGIIAHILLAAVYGGQKAGVYGATGVLSLDLVVIATPILVGGWGASFWGRLLRRRPEQLRPRAVVACRSNLRLTGAPMELTRFRGQLTTWFVS